MATKAAQVSFLIAGMLKTDATINSAGTVDFFSAQAGSWATPKNAFEEADKSTAITTLTLDAAGKGTAFCDGVYDIRIKDSDGNTVDSLLEVNFIRQDPLSGTFNIEVITGASNVQLDGDEDIVIVNTASDINVTLASSATADGRKIVIKTINASTGTISILATTPDTIDGVAAATGVDLTAQYDALELVADSTNATYHRATRGTLLADTISESTAATGVTADGVLLKDSTVTASGGVVASGGVDAGTSPGVTTDVIDEKTADAGVTIDSVLIKDLAITVDTIDENTVDTGVTIDSFLIKDNAPDPTSWPSFKAEQDSNQNNINGETKVDFKQEVFDTNADYAAGTSTFTPTVAGKYLLTVQIAWADTVDGDSIFLYIFKNGANTNGAITSDIASGTTHTSSVTTIVTADGDDTFEVYTRNFTTTTADLTQAIDHSYFAGSRIA